MARRETTTTAPKISRDDLEGKFRELRGEVDTTTEKARGYLVAVGAVAAVLFVAAVFLVGKRRGRKKRTFVEVRRL